MIIIGGTYAELTDRPQDSRMRGSGLRAAIALRELADVQLHTFALPSEREEVDSLAAIHGPVAVSVHGRSRAITFRYFTPLSPPAIDGLGASYEDVVEVGGNTVLRYGLLEVGPAPLIKARTLVVDPQGGDVDSLIANATYERLAVVANEREAQTLSGRSEPEEAAAALCERVGASVVTVKCGARGAVGVTPDGAFEVGSFPSARVAPIGSGDIFAAAFAWAYGERGDDAVSAARYASRAASQWCGRGDEPALSDRFEQRTEVAFGPRPHVYLAGPFFGLAQHWLTDLARTALRELGASPFSPLHDVGLGGPEVATRDLAGLEAATAVLALLDDLDTGTVFEIGWAIRHGIPIVGYLDPRPAKDLVMLEGTGVDLTGDLATAVYRAIWTGMGRQ